MTFDEIIKEREENRAKLLKGRAETNRYYLAEATIDALAELRFLLLVKEDWDNAEISETKERKQETTTQGI